MKLIEFTDGSSTTEFVGKKSAFKDPADFLEQCKREWDWKFDELDFEIKKEHVQDRAYCRYYPNMPEDYSHLGLESGYTFCERGVAHLRFISYPFVIYMRNMRMVRNNNDT